VITNPRTPVRGARADRRIAATRVARRADELDDSQEPLSDVDCEGVELPLDALIQYGDTPNHIRQYISKRSWLRGSHGSGPTRLPSGDQAGLQTQRPGVGLGQCRLFEALRPARAPYEAASLDGHRDGRNERLRARALRRPRVTKVKRPRFLRAFSSCCAGAILLVDNSGQRAG